MCTVSFIHTAHAVIITSNRDERLTRPMAIAPKTYAVAEKLLRFPKDPQAGGTWIVADQFSNVAVLLNGAFRKHRPHGPYRRSRGLVLLDLFAAPHPIKAWDSIDLEAIEPFTVVLYHQRHLYSLVWDGGKKERAECDPLGYHLWSSATLFDEKTRKEKERLFREFVEKDPHIQWTSIREFHRQATGFVINTADGMRTQSISQVVLEGNRTRFSYFNQLYNGKHGGAPIVV